MLGELEQVADWLVMIHQGKALYNGPARAFFDQRTALIVETEDTAQRDLVARIAGAAGYTITVDNDALTIVCPLDFSAELRRQAGEAGVAHLTIRAKETSFAERFLTLLKGEP